MTAAHSTVSAPQGKPAKPVKPEGCPLFPHASGRWAKKIQGRFVYFGKWTDLAGALTRYEEFVKEKRKPPERNGAGPTVDKLCNAYLRAQFLKVKSGSRSTRTYHECVLTTDLIVDHFGKRCPVASIKAADFEDLLAKISPDRNGRKGLGAVRRTNVIHRVRGVFNYGWKTGDFPQVNFGPDFHKPDQKEFDKEKNEGGENLFTPEEVRTIIDAASQPMKAMIMLGINSAYGNNDCATLPQSALDLDGGWVTYPRPKTAVRRRCWLWPETVAALREALADRPTPKLVEDANLVFVTKYGRAWGRAEVIDKEGTITAAADSPISKEMSKLLKRLKINGRKRLGMYTLRHSFRTAADEARDLNAIDCIMGHKDSSMGGKYRHALPSDERLKAVAEHVRAWLFDGALESS